MILLDSKERERFLKFALVGTIGAGIDFGMMNLLTQAFNLVLVISGTISFVCAVISNFLWNRYWTYPESRTKNVAHQLFMFFIVNLAGVLIRIPILNYVEPPLLNYIEQINLRVSVSSEFLAKNLTLSLAIGIVMLWNFFVNRYWTYNDIDNLP
jgi:putative flippase GtrA